MSLERMYQVYGTTAQWTSADPILEAGEIGVEDTGTAHFVYVGDGVNNWSSLSPIGRSDLAAYIASLVSAGALVTSVFTRTGDITAQAGDYTAAQITETAAAKIMTSTERDQLAALVALGDRPAAAEPTVSGVLSGGAVTLASGLLVDIAAGAGVVVNGYTTAGSPSLTDVSWNAETNVSVIPGSIGPDDSTVYIGKDSTGTTVVQASAPTEQEHQDNIWLAIVILSANQNAIAGIVDFPTVGFSASALLASYLRRTNIAKEGGGALSAAGGLGLAISALMLWGRGLNWRTDPAKPNHVTVAAQNPATLAYWLGTGAGIDPTTTEVDPTEYEPTPGTLSNAVYGTAMDPAWTNQVVFVTPGGLAIILRGTEVYGDKTSALAGIDAENAARSWPEDLQAMAVYAGVITVRADAADTGFGDLSDTNVCEFTTAAQETAALGNQAISAILTASDYFPQSDAANGDVLIVAGLPDGPFVTTAAPGGGGWKYIASYSPSTNKFTINAASAFDGTYRKIKMEPDGVHLASDGNLHMRVSQAATEQTGGTAYEWALQASYYSSNAHTGATDDDNINLTATSFDVDGDAAASIINGEIILQKPGAAGVYRVFKSEIEYYGSGGGNIFLARGNSRFKDDTDAIDAVIIYGRNGGDTGDVNFDGGQVHLFGWVDA